MNKDSIWMTWENQRRNRELSKALGIPLFEFSEIDSIRNYFKKYSKGLIKTYAVIRKTRPKFVFCQNPSLVLSSFAILLKYFVKYRVIVDAHNAGLVPYNGKFMTINMWSNLVQRHADLTIVSNEQLKKVVIKNGGRAFVLQDMIPAIETKQRKYLKGKQNIMFICSYADDEPYEIVFEAAKRVKREIFIYVTGRYQKKGIIPGNLPENVLLTGFLTEDEYITMLNSVDATIDLTTRENCLVCGAYESVALEKPMILSKTKALMEYFNKGAVYVEHNINSIASGINEVIRQKEELKKQIRALKKIRNIEWLQKKEDLEEILREF